MKRQKKTEQTPKQVIIDALKGAYDDTLIIQDRYCERIEHMESVGTSDFEQRLKELGWKGVLKAMSSVTWNPTDQDRKKYLNQEWDQTPMHYRLEKIEDFDIQFHTYMLNCVVQHAFHLHAIAMFHETLGSNPDDDFANMLMNFWVCYTLSNHFIEEIKDKSGNEDLLKRLETLAELSELLFTGMCEQQI